MSATRADVVAEALTWLGTPYHPHARVKGAGVDCAQMPIAVYSACGIIPELHPEYARDWHLHRGEELYLEYVERFATEIARGDAGPGDFAIWKFGRTFSHGGILRDYQTVIHSYISVGVTLDNIDQHCELMSRERRFYSVWGTQGGR